MPDVATHYDPFDDSLCGEYARMLVLGTTAASAAVWACRLAAEPAAIVMVVANVLIMGIAVGSLLEGLRRLAILSLLVVGVIVTFAAKQDAAIWWSPLVLFSPAVTVAALLVLFIRDALIAIKMRSIAMTPRKILVALAILATATHMVVIPGIEALLDSFRDRPTSLIIEDLSALERLRIRSAKFAVFSIFAYAGACVGSFLNVVAASAPRRESIALRRSACPRCGTPIRRTDNFPIVSYLQLGGRCRTCESVIPVRYLNVELFGLVIFSTLFLAELITGATNVPGFQRYHYAGILWIIMYTKWPVVGIYFFHCLLFSVVMMLALMEQERLRVPRWMVIALPCACAGIVIAFPTMLTVSLGDQTPLRLPTAIPIWLDRAATCAAGGLTGWAVGLLAKSTRLRRRQSNSSLTLSFVLLGVSLGWQAVLTIASLWLATILLLKVAGGRLARPRWLTASTLLLVIAMLHHPAWKWLANHLSF